MKLAALLCSLLLGCGMALAQEQSSGTVNSLSVDPQQNQKLSGSMGTETGQPNDVSRGEDRNQQLANPSNSPISGQASSGSSSSSHSSATSASKQTVPGGKPSANQNSASTNSGNAPRRSDNDEANQQTSKPQTSNTPH